MDVPGVVASFRVSLALSLDRRLPLAAVRAITSRVVRMSGGGAGPERGPASTSLSGRSAPATKLDPSTRAAVLRRRFTAQLERAANSTEFYQDQFGAVDRRRALTIAQIESLPITTRADLAARPLGFVSSGVRPMLVSSTTGTTGPPVSVHFSRYEIALAAELTAQHLAARRFLLPGSVLFQCISSRAAIAVQTMAGACSSLGSTLHPIGLIDPAECLRRLMRYRSDRSVERVLNTHPSYLGELIEEASRSGIGPEDVRISRVICGGEVLTSGLKRRTAEAFGSGVEIVENAAMTETVPAGGFICEQDHMHFEPTSSLVSRRALDGDRPAMPDEPGTLVVTPLPPYRECTLLIRYDTGDVVEEVDGDLRCSEAHLPAVSRVLGKRDRVVRTGTQWIFPRDVLEVLEDIDEVPLPARYHLSGGVGDLVLSVRVRAASVGAADRVREGLARAGLTVERIVLVPRVEDLPEPNPVRADLREASLPPVIGA